MTADQPLVTHADLADLDALRSMVEDFDSDAADRQVDLLDRLIAHAEADKPALPEGWVLRKGGAVHWHQGGCLYNNPEDLVMTWSERDVERQRRQGDLTPLVTAASLVPEGWHVDGLRVRGAAGGEILHQDQAPHAFRVLAALVTAAKAERGESR